MTSPTRRASLSVIFIGVLSAATLMAAIAVIADGSDPTHEAATRSGGAPVDPDGGPPVPPNLFTDPLASEAVQIDSPSEADTAFHPDVPQDLPDPQAIESSDPAKVAPIDRSIAWAYDDSTYGRFIVVEVALDATQATLEEPATHKPGCSPPDEQGAVHCYGEGFSVQDLSDGTRALVTEAPEVTTVEWFEPLDEKKSASLPELKHPVLDIRVMGPSDTFSREMAVTIANGI
jgi:hypothetical protein